MYVVHPHDVQSEPSESGHFRTLLSPDLGGALGVYLLTITRSAPHVHDAEDQVYIVQSGRAVAEVDDERREVGPGDLVYVPRGSRHSLAALGDAPVVLYSLMHEIGRRE